MIIWDWVMMLLYVFLVVIFMFCCFYIKIGSNWIIIIKGNWECFIGVDDIVKFRFEQGMVVIEYNSCGKRWVFIKLLNCYDIDVIFE